MPDVSDKTVMLTGGAGFVGSRFAKKLVDAGAKVMAYDNLSFGRREFLKEIEENPLFKFVKGDLLDFEFLDSQVKRYEPDVVIHLAANPDLRKSFQNTRLDLEQGTIVTYNVLESARRNDIDDILFSSSSVVYGEASIKPTPEDYGPLRPISLYGASKLACEGLMTAFSHLYDFNYYIYRFANVVGEGLTHSVILDFINKLKANNKELEVLGDGKQKKSYLEVGDCVDAMMLVYQKSNEKQNIYNIAPGDQIAVEQIAMLVKDRLAPDAKIKYTGGRSGWPGDIPDSYLSNTKIKSLGFNPVYKSSKAAVIQAIESNS